MEDNIPAVVQEVKEDNKSTDNKKSDEKTRIKLQIDVADKSSQKRFTNIVKENNKTQKDFMLDFMNYYDKLKSLADSKTKSVEDLITYFIENNEKIQNYDELNQKYGELESQLSKKDEENIKLQSKINELENDRFADLKKSIEELENFSSKVKEHGYFHKIENGQPISCLYAQLESSE